MVNPSANLVNELLTRDHGRRSEKSSDSYSKSGVFVAIFDRRGRANAHNVDAPSLVAPMVIGSPPIPQLTFVKVWTKNSPRAVPSKRGDAARAGARAGSKNFRVGGHLPRG
jgi:hypothetical protein